MPIEKLTCLTLLMASQFSGGFARPQSLRRQLGTVICTEEQCRDRFTTMNAAGYLTGEFYSYGDIPTKGCFIKDENMYFGIGGTIEEMMDSDLNGIQERVWCDATATSSSTVGRSGNDGYCLTMEECEEKFTMMKEAMVTDGYFYASEEFPTMGCFMKNDNVFFGIGGTDEEMTDSDLPGVRLRVLCDGTSSRPQPSNTEDREDDDGFWTQNKILGVAFGGVAALPMLLIGLTKRCKNESSDVGLNPMNQKTPNPHSDLPPKETRRSTSENKDDWGPNNVFCGKLDCC